VRPVPNAGEFRHGLLSASNRVVELTLDRFESSYHVLKIGLDRTMHDVLGAANIILFEQELKISGEVFDASHDLVKHLF